MIMEQNDETGFFDKLGEILNAPLPGTARKQTGPAGATDEDDDESVLERIKDILQQPLPGTTTASQESANILLSKTGGVPANMMADQSLLANEAGEVVLDIVANSIVPPSKAFIQTAQWVTLRMQAPLLMTGDLTPEEFGQVIDDARE